MTRESRITVKGQVTIPKDVRDLLGVRPGQAVVFEREGDRVFVRKSEPAPVDLAERRRRFQARLAEARKLAKPLPLGMTTDEYMAMIREPVPPRARE
jgi:AbrB family looped-hinge helix DNA binding protein